MFTIHFSFLLLFANIVGSCKDTSVNPPPPLAQNHQWVEVPEFVNLDIRCMIHFNDELYASVVHYQGDTVYPGAILKTTDGNTWRLVKTFTETIGPMTVENDSLYVMSDHFIFVMDVIGNWNIKFDVPWDMAEAEWIGDMVFLNGNLLVIQTRFTGYMYHVSRDGVWKKVISPPALDGSIWGAKFLKIKKDGKDVLYLRPSFNGNGITFFRFDGVNFIRMQNGFSNSAVGFNSIVFHNDTLFAGFRPNSHSSGIISFWNGDEWKMYGDSIPNNRYAPYFIPPLITMPTAIIFIGNELFIATDVHGIFSKKYGEPYKTLNKGLLMSQSYSADMGVFNTISFLEHFKGNLFVGYGNPAYMWGTLISGPRMGLLKYRLGY
ncbi:MAG: hypothetical protein M0R68_09400 [Bacteroidetes bacterium]|nr:hypothetical protein [Bacteroidota bacterium]